MMSRPKGSKNKKKKVKEVVIKKKIGRPKKIRTEGEVVKIKKKLGRPKKVHIVKTDKSEIDPVYIKKAAAYSKYNSLPDDYVQPKTHKITGYCPKCDLPIMSNDFVSKLIFECPCGVRKHKKYLKEKSARVIEQEKEDARISKTEYLKEAASRNKELEKYHGSTHLMSDIPDISIMSEVKED